MTIPEGYMRDAKARLIPIETIKPIDLARDDLVREIVKKALELRETLRQFRASTFDDIEAFCDLAAEKYETKLGGQKGNITLMSFDGKYKVLRAIHDSLAFDEGLQTAKALIDECVTEWLENSRPEIKALINDAFQVDKAGKISTGRVLGLRRLAIDHPKWLDAMTALSESVQVQCSKAYVRVYQRVDNSERYEPISLDIAGV